MGFHRRQKFAVRVAASTANDTDLLEFVIPDGQEVDVYNLQYVSKGQPSSGDAVRIELVSSANDNILDVNASGLPFVIAATSDISSGAHRIVNSTGADAYYKLRTDGALTSAGIGTVILDMDYPDAT